MSTERVISPERIWLSTRSLCSFANTYSRTRNRMSEHGFLVDIPVTRIMAKSDKKVLTKILR